MNTIHIKDLMLSIISISFFSFFLHHSIFKSIHPMYNLSKKIKNKTTERKTFYFHSKDLKWSYHEKTILFIQPCPNL